MSSATEPGNGTAHRIVTCFTCLCLMGPVAAAPRLYDQAAYQSPVRGEPDDLLLIAGYALARDDVVVYQAIADTTRVPATPSGIPSLSTAATGIAPVVSTAGIPYSLTVKLPSKMQTGQSYALWVRSEDGWSNAIKINDARPLWITPVYAYSTHAISGLPRYVKVVGRNLQPAPGATTLIRLAGPQTMTLAAKRDSGAIDQYAAQADLPARLQPGEYQVQISRDGTSWVALQDQLFSVRHDPGNTQAFPVADFGCRPDDDRDDVHCIASAIAAASAARGGRVVFGAGVWDMIDSNADEVTLDGLVVPPGVSLTGAGAAATTLLRHAAWGNRSAKHRSRSPVSFTLQGRNTVQGLEFSDARIYQPGDVGSTGGILQLGKPFYRSAPNDPVVVADVIITQNIFDRSINGVGNGGLPIERLTVVGNEFGSFKDGLNLGGNRYNVKQRFRVLDSIIADNVFKPGSYIDAGIQQGSSASHIGAARRLDFSNNIADGSSTQYLQNPQRDPRGWRAAFFWHMADSHEMMLVARNTATCTGDKAGDGEAIAYDNDMNTFAFSGARTVIAATAGSVFVSGPLQDRQEGQPVDLRNYYVGHWLRVVEGPGVGQVRRIEAHDSMPDATVGFRVSPDWDVVPTRSSRISVGREYWQVHTVDNLIDHRRPLCAKSNANGPEGGEITLYAQFADSAVEGNRQYDTDGITLHHSYSAEDPACPTCKSLAFFQSFVDVRGNTIEGEYDWMSDCSQSGILVAHSAAPTPSSPPPIIGYALSISHNSITHADGTRGGAITLPVTWHKGPPPHNWRLLDSTLVHHNVIRDVAHNVPYARCDHQQSRRIGINLYEQSLAWGTVLYANSCAGTSVPFVNRGKQTVLVCPSSTANSCECRAAPQPPTIESIAMPRSDRAPSEALR